jgi:hypothetical protein
MSAKSDLGNLLAALAEIEPTELPNFPRVLDVTGVLVDCQAVIEAAAAFIRSRMQDVQHHTGSEMEAESRASEIVDIFADDCRPMFYAAEHDLEEQARAAA